MLDKILAIKKVLADITVVTDPVVTDPVVTDQLPNPLGETDTIAKLLTKILEIVVQIGIPMVALALVYTGFLFVAARGNESKLTEAKTTLFWTVIGAAIVLGAFAIRTAIEGTITSLGG